MSASKGIKAKTKVKINPKRSLRFLGLEKVQFKLTNVNQTPSMVESDRQKDVDVRFNSIISHSKEMQDIQSALDFHKSVVPKVPRRRSRSRSDNDMALMPGMDEPKPQISATQIKQTTSIPGFKYHVNGDEKKSVKKHRDDGRVTRLQNRIVEESMLLDGWKMGPLWMREASRQSNSGPINQVRQRALRAKSLLEDNSKVRSIIVMSRGGRHSSPPGKDLGLSLERRYRRRQGSPGPRLGGRLKSSDANRSSDVRTSGGYPLKLHERTVSFVTDKSEMKDYTPRFGSGTVYAYHRSSESRYRQSSGREINAVALNNDASFNLGRSGSRGSQGSFSLSLAQDINRTFSRVIADCLYTPNYDERVDEEARRSSELKDKAAQYVKAAKDFVINSLSDFDLDQLKHQKDRKQPIRLL